VELSDLYECLRRLDADDFTVVACAIDSAHQTAADEVEAWEDLMRVDELLRQTGRSRVAARAAHDAVHAVRIAEAETAVPVPSETVTRVAREAALLARAIVAGASETVAHLRREFAFVQHV
jgi:hypothetical protein